jgi:hypothetical protein
MLLNATANVTLKRLSTITGLGLSMLLAAIPFAAADEAVPIALLSTTMQNDHRAWVPTTDAERRRMDETGHTFRTMLEESGKYKFIALSDELRQRIDRNQQPGQCGGCEIVYGKEIGASQVAWIHVQKVSELILNINLYIKDVDSGRMTFWKSVDLRGNNDESWQRSMRSLVKHYLLPSQN